MLCNLAAASANHRSACINVSTCVTPGRVLCFLFPCLTTTRAGRGRLGLGTLERQDPNPKLRKYFPTPTLIPFFRGKKVLQVACSANHTLALVRDENQVYSWGCGDGGRLGHGDAEDR